MNTCFRPWIIGHKFSSAVLARNREVSLHDHRSHGIVLAEIFPAQQQKIAEISRAGNKQQTKQRPRKNALDNGASVSQVLLYPTAFQQIDTLTVNGK